MKQTKQTNLTKKDSVDLFCTSWVPRHLYFTKKGSVDLHNFVIYLFVYVSNKTTIFLQGNILIPHWQSHEVLWKFNKNWGSYSPVNESMGANYTHGVQWRISIVCFSWQRDTCSGWILTMVRLRDTFQGGWAFDQLFVIMASAVL